MTTTTSQDVRIVLVMSMGPNDSIVSGLISMAGVGPRRKTNPSSARTMSPTAMRWPRVSLTCYPSLSLPLIQCFHQEKIAASKGQRQPKEQAQNGEQAI